MACGPCAFEQEDVANHAWNRRDRPGLLDSGADRSRGVLVERVRIEIEGEIDARQLAVEFLREVGGARLQAGAHAGALRFTDLSEPPVLQHRERDQQHGEKRAGDQLPRRTSPVVEINPHGITVREMRQRILTLYISYKTIAQR